MASIWIQFVGILKPEIGNTKVEINIDTPITVSTTINRLATSFKLKQDFLLELETGSLRQNALILVNDKDISVLDGLESKLEDDDVLTIIPFSHGG